MARDAGESCGECQPHWPSRTEVHVRERTPEAPYHLQGTLRIDPRQYEHKFLTTETGRYILLAASVLQQLRQGHEDAIAHIVPPIIVHPLEVVQVHDAES